MPSDPFQNPEFLAQVHALEDLDALIADLQDQRYQLLHKLEAMEA